MRKGIAAVAVLALAAGAATGQWSDNFDGYADGTNLHGVGGWKGWDNDPTWTAFVTDDYALSAPHSVEIALNSDLVHEYDATAGQWTYIAWQYIPSSFAGQTYFIMLNNYNDAPGDKNWSIQIPFDSSTGLMTDDYSGESRPYITDRWVELRLEIDLDNNFREVYYDGAYFSSWTWTTDANSILEIGAVDLFANGASPVYYDDMALIPAPASALALLGLAALRRRR